MDERLREKTIQGITSCRRNEEEGEVGVMKERGLTPFEVLDEISSAWAGKQIFFLEKNGMIYDRYESEYITLEEAVHRMARRVGWDGEG